MKGRFSKDLIDRDVLVLVQATRWYSVAVQIWALSNCHSTNSV